MENILAAQGGYLTDNLYLFKSDSEKQHKLEKVNSDSTAKLKWLVIGREHYFETSIEYPIANKRELKQALKLDDVKAPYNGITLQLIERTSEQSHRVTFWVIKPDVVNSLNSKPWFIFPESYLLAKAISKDNHLAKIEAINNKVLFLSNTKQANFSGVKSKNIATLEHFVLSTGSPIPVNFSEHFNTKPADFAKLLFKGVKSLDLFLLPNFTAKLSKSTLRELPWKKMLYISTVVFSLYIALTSSWLVFKEKQLSSQIKKQTTQVNQALSLQKEYRKNVKWQKQLSQPFDARLPYWKVWPIILDVLSTGVIFEAIHFQNNQIILHGMTGEKTKATDVLAKLSENIYVSDASFSQPVRKVRNKEDFAITFSFSASALLNPKSNDLGQK